MASEMTRRRWIPSRWSAPTYSPVNIRMEEFGGIAKLGGETFFKTDTVDGVDAGFAKAIGCCARDGEVTAADQ